MNKLKFFVCPECGNIITSTGDASVSCCGRKLEALTAVKCDSSNSLKEETVEDEWYISSEHEMTKDHFISFVAFVTGEKMFLVKQYPEWNLQARFQQRGHGKLYYFCNKHGLFYQLI